MAEPRHPHREEPESDVSFDAVGVLEDEPEDFAPAPMKDAPEPVAPRPTTPRRALPASSLVRYADLVSDLVLGRTHLLLLADPASGQSSRALAEDLVGDALAKGLSVALIDAGTGMRTDSAGLSDLSTGAASFGDVVQKSADNAFAEVTWGRAVSIDRRSTRPQTLVEALGDIYEVVVVLTGPVGAQSSIEVFAELGGRIVLVADDESEIDRAEAARLTLENAGLARVEITARTEPVAA